MSDEQEFLNFLKNVTIIKNNETETWSKFKLPFWRQMLWTTLFGLTVLVGTIGNGLVIWIVWSNKNMRTVTNYPLVNLAVSDALTLTLNTVFNFYTMLHNEWYFGHYCKFTQFISTVCVSVSVFTLMMISIDRYKALVVDVTRGPPSKRTTLLIGVAIWTGSAAISAPAFVMNEYIQEISVINGTITILRSFCVPPTNYKSIVYYYNIFFMIFTCIVPIVCITYSYIRVGNVLWGSERIGECIDARRLRAIEDRKRMVRMMIVVVILFAVSWSPYQMYFVIEPLYPDLNTEPFVQEMYLAIYWLAMSHSAYQPIIYWYFIKNFRNGFKNIYRRWPCCSRDEVNLESSGWSMSVMSSRLDNSNKQTRNLVKCSFE